MELEHLNRREPGARPDLVRLLTTAARVIALAVGAILSLTGIYLLLDVYFTIATFVQSPATLEPVLAAWDAALRGTPAVTPPVTEAQQVPFLRFISDLVSELSNGNLARPIGGFIVFLFMTILFRVAVAVLGAGTKLLLALAAPAGGAATGASDNFAPED